MSAVASVISTGGAGNDFERRVGAYFLALLLTKSFAPVFTDSAPVRVHFQAGRLGWCIDDLVVEVASEAGQLRNLAAQVKRTFTVSSADQECIDTVTAAWKDFNNSALFQQGRDAIVLVTYLGTNRIQHDLRWLLAQAKAAGTSADFDSRRTGQGTLNKRAKSDYEEIKKIIDAAEGSAVPDDRVWRFLQAFHVLSFDFHDASGKDEAAIRTILGALRANGAPLDVAATSWTELIDFAGLAASEGRSVELAGLPAETQQRHKQVPSTKHAELARLRQHSAVTLRRISDAGPRGVIFARAALRRKLEEAFAKHQVVLVVGPAGCGKSALGKNFLANGGSSDTTLAFAAEEFKTPHIDAVLANANINLIWAELSGLLPLHRKTLLVDGLERLLEAADRAAFKDLLFAAKEDKSLSLVITCRDYYAEVVERSLLAASGVDFATVIVEGLTDEELEQAAASAPVLSSLIANPTLRPLLRNPFLLTRAAELRLAEGEAIPHTERALRRRMWGDLVRDDGYVAGGMPAKRERVFFSVCVERARALRPFVAVADDDGAVQRLANDNLVVADETGSRFAAAHDVLEDWGLVEWFMRRFEESAGSAVAMAQDVGEHPALRRAYRKWLTEQLDVDAGSVSRFVAEASTASEMPSHFKDDTWLAVFQSQAADGFMSQLSATLVASGAALLRRVLHLVRVGCKTVAPLSQMVKGEFRWHVPSGAAWQLLLRFCAQHWTQLPRDIDPLLVQFMEDWAGCISAEVPYPAGSDCAGTLIGNMLALPAPGPRERLVQLLLKVPRANAPLFANLAQRATAPGRSLRDDEDAEALAKNTFKPFQAVAFARDFPSELIAVCRGRWLLPAGQQHDERWHRRELENVFGLTHSYEHRFFPPSSMQGPFSVLLQHHHQDAVVFIVDLLNHCCAAYMANTSGGDETLEAPIEVVLTLQDGTARTILFNQRLWLAHRGTSVFPGVLECALMALESKLLDMCRRGATAEVVQSYLDYLLRQSNNAATLAVVASVATAYPALAGPSGVGILGCAEFVRIDTARMIADQRALAPGGVDAFAQMFQRERVDSNALAHRKQSLEDLARNLQLRPERGAVEALLDRYVAELPPEEQRSRHESQWLLALRRMDLRAYSATPVEGGIQLSMRPLPSDVQSMIAQSAADQEPFLRKVRLQNWARAALDRNAAESAGEWREILALARAVEAEIASSGSRDIMDGGPRMVAAAVARDHWAELAAGEQGWCMARLEDALGATPNASDIFGGSIPVDGTSECASVLGQLAPIIPRASAEGLLISAVTHHNHHVQKAAIQGLAVDAFMNNPELLNFALHLLSTDASLRVEQDARIDETRCDERPQPAELLRERRQRLMAADKTTWTGAPSEFDAAFLEADDALVEALLPMLRSRQGHPVAQRLFEWVGTRFGEWWNREERGRSNFDLQFAAREAFAEFILGSEPARARELLETVLQQVDDEPREFSELLDQMLHAADRRGDAATFWPLWSTIAARVGAASWVGHLASGHSRGEELIKKLFLNTGWKPGLREWRLLGTAHEQIDAVFSTLPAAKVVLEAYLRYLVEVGARSLPGAIAVIDSKFGTALQSVLISSSISKTLLDQIASRLMFEQLPALQHPSLRDSMLHVLEALIQAGSSNAFLLREDFLTPSGGAVR